MKKIFSFLVGLGMLCGVAVQVNANTLEDFQYTFYQKSNLYAPLEQKTKIIDAFGQGRGGYMHQGIDVVAAMYTPIYAVADGVVTKASPDSKGVDNGGGHMVFIDHGDGTQSWYMHLSAYGVEEGDVVRAGDLIALSGASGDVTGPHLHLEYRVNGVPVDPYFIFDSFGLFEVHTETESVDQIQTFEESFRVKQQ